ncbi:Isoquinoline 1-oxidoreductase subunit [Paroceanicella profunda]|uniref:Isoquinoline 1-oxidoreductase subunit n=1 Tax=Paroceanicella profunda TaxID=2579971 RepID=A0A5B8FYB1_9RHOB|nr:Isoquinoline 1-oxidoreductase subunit [Paroceanicella profunda]QDL91619.1 Isoquinoline 1-oxidoreductase subunit [Paroceanicella profunda]
MTTTLFTRAARAALLLPVLMAPLAAAAQDSAAETLQAPEAFAGITDEAARSAALFGEIGKVIESPRCMNCHPVTGGPTQGDDLHTHIPPVVRGEADMGAPGMSCNTCHGVENVTFPDGKSSIPGHEAWHLAPVSMGWQGVSLADICVQIKDPERNGGRNLEDLYEHMAQDSLVGWAWHPGEGRAPAPGTQEQLGTLMRAWIDTGAACPQG